MRCRNARQTRVVSEGKRQQTPQGNPLTLSHDEKSLRPHKSSQKRKNVLIKYKIADMVIGTKKIKRKLLTPLFHGTPVVVSCWDSPRYKWLTITSSTSASASVLVLKVSLKENHWKRLTLPIL
jgi:hypothetical protein